MKTIVLGLCFLAGMGISASAQICAGSHLGYYVRDARGRLMSADANGLIYEPGGDDPKTYSSWTAERIGTRHAGFDVPSDLALFDKSKDQALVVRGMCGFRRPADLKLTLAGNVMELHFALPDMGGGTMSADFAVDSMPFTPGRFMIDLTKPTTAASFGRYGGYFAASAWKKIN